ncbi:MAG: ribonuclease [Pseudomonadota bacterium]
MLGLGIGLGLMLAGCQDEAASTKGGLPFTGPMVLAISWQPAFCERAQRRRECRTQTSNRYDANHFSLHGLWPQPASNTYCGVSADQERLDRDGKWRRLDMERLPQALWDRLRRTMPGTRSNLHRHEWVKHGTCYSKTAETYYAHSLGLMDALNASSVRALFGKNIGRSLRNSEIRAAFDKAFGAGVGDRVRVSCRRDGRRELIVELTLGLAGAISAPNMSAADLGALALAAPTTRPGCPVGIVDPAGFQ